MSLEEFKNIEDLYKAKILGTIRSPVKNIMLAKGQNSTNNNFMNSPI